MAGESININRAGEDELIKMRMLGKERARALIKYREEHGPFKDWSDVNRIPGFSRQMIEDMKRSGASLDGD